MFYRILHWLFQYPAGTLDGSDICELFTSICQKHSNHCNQKLAKPSQMSAFCSFRVLKEDHQKSENCFGFQGEIFKGDKNSIKFWQFPHKLGFLIFHYNITNGPTCSGEKGDTPIVEDNITITVSFHRIHCVCVSCSALETHAESRGIEQLSISLVW